MVWLIFLFLVSPLFAQQPDVVGLTDFPVPAWPANGVVDASLKDRYVFVDLPKNEYVVAYPENLGTDAFANSPGRMKITRYELLRNVAPQVSVAITPLNSTRYKYSYNVANATTAKQSIDTFVLALTERSSTDVIRQPEGWFGILQKSRSFKLKNPEWIKGGAAAVWSFQKADHVIPPGSSQNGFDLDSDLRPGFTVSYLRKSESVEVKYTTQGNVPKEVKEQFDQLLQLEYNSRTILTIGPKFDKSTDSRTIAEDFVQGIVTLSRAGELDLSSEFVRSVMAELTAIKPGASVGLKFSIAPGTPAETALFNALRVSLRVN